MSSESRTSTLESAADPRYQIAEEFDSEDVFVAAVPIETAERTSAVAETAAAPEKAIALAAGLIEEFRRKGGPGAFTVRRDDVADRLFALVRNPSLVEQGSLNLCGPAAFLRIWIDRDPVAFIRFAAELFEKGSAKIGGMEVEAGEDLREQDYYGTVLPAMKGRAPSAAHVAEYVCPSAEWMVMSALRDSANFFFDFEGMPDEDVSAATTPGEVADWLRATRLYSSVADDGNWVFTKGLSHALGLAPGPNQDVAVLLNAHMLSGSTKKKSDDFIMRAFPNHFVVLESRITQPTPDTVRFDYWSWGERATCTANKDVFNANYYGAVSARGATAATQGLSASAVASAEEALIDSHTSWGNLDEAALGWDLLNRLPADAAFVGRVLNTLSDTDRDDVGYAIANKANDPQLQQIAADPAGRSLLMRIVRELSGGFTDANEAREIERIVRLASPAHHRLQEEAWSSSPAVVAALRANGLELQTIRAGWGERVYDEYAITVEQMPPGTTPENFLLELSQDLNRTVNNPDFDTWNVWRRRSTAAPPQVGDLMDVDILGPVNATVMFVDVQPERFVFQTVRTGVMDSAPEWGAREFGFERNPDGSVTFFTRGTTTALTKAVAVGGGVPQEKSWTAWAKGVEAELNRRGGRTRAGSFHGWTTHSLERALFSEVYEAAPAVALSGGKSFFLPPERTNDYFDYIQPPTQGTATLLINGRDSQGPSADVDLNEPHEQMQIAVQSAGAGDAVYLAGWVFDPMTPLSGGSYAGPGGNAGTWGELLAAKAREGVTVRILMSDFDEIAKDFYADARANSRKLDRLIAALPESTRPNLAYKTSLHPARTGPIKGVFATGDFRFVNVASHHTKLMVVRIGEDRYAFCGGVDISPSRTRVAWGRNPIWHDLHVMLQGPITRDIEKEFVLRWNRETLNIWNPESIKGQLALPPKLKSSDRDNRAELRQTPMQMLRTVSDNAWTSPWDTKRNDIKRVYKNLVMGAEDFLYFENQYFRSLDLADWIVERAKKNPNLKAIFVVLARPAEGDDEITLHGMNLQYRFFDRVTNAMGNRVGIYTMSGRMVHSKFALADDARVIIGSANANGRSFEVDTEIAVAIEDPTVARQWRLRAWAHAVGPAGADPWATSSAAFLSQWATIAAANARLPLDQMTGEGVVPYDWRALPGKRNKWIPDELAMMDFDAAGEVPASVGEPGVAIA